jgi:hypothetical protein
MKATITKYSVALAVILTLGSIPSAIAYYQTLQYTIVPSAGPNGLINPPEAVVVNYGDSQEFTAIPNEGYQVYLWLLDEFTAQFGGTTFTLSNIQSNHIVYVIFETAQYTITASADSNGSVSPPEPVVVNYGDSQEYTASPNEDYQVDVWYLDNVAVQYGGTTFTLSNIQSNHMVHVTFKTSQYTISASAGSNGSISPSESVFVNPGDSQEFTATPNDGYQVNIWYLDNVAVQFGGTTYTLSNIQSNHMVHVTFSAIQHTITTSAGPNGSVSPPNVTLPHRSNHQFTANPDLGFKVDKWYLDGSISQIGGRTYMLTNIQSDHNIHVTFRRRLFYFLDSIEFDDRQEFLSRIFNNNYSDPNNPELSRTHIARVTGQYPDPNGMMLMTNLLDKDLMSPTYGQIVYAHVKGVFPKINVDEITIRFKYLFNTSKSDARLIIYLSDSPILRNQSDSQFAVHNFKVAELYAPPRPRPGSSGSNRFGIFNEIVSIGHLDFTDRIYIDLILVEPAQNPISIASAGQTSVMIDSWSPAVQCYGICLDINWDNFVNEADFLTVISKLGTAAIDDQTCLEGVFGRDGTLDGLDVASWDWAMNSSDRLLNFCGVPLDNGYDAEITAAATAFYQALLQQHLIDDLSGNLSDLLILGKRGGTDAASKLKDNFYLFNSDVTFAGYSTPASERCNIRLVKSPDGEIYIINAETGLTQISHPEQAVVPPGKVNNVNEPRYNKSATVYVGIQSEDENVFGRPVLDAAFDADYVYVMPVVVAPDGEKSYTAAAQLQLLENSNPPYQITRLYDDPPLENDNQYRDNLRELEIDRSGNLYVLNVHRLNESNILWKYDPNGAVTRFDLGMLDSNNYLPAPVGMCVSEITNTLYLASAMCDSDNTNSTTIYGFSTNGSLQLERSITIYGMQQISSITENPSTGSLWVAGFNLYSAPLYPNPFQPAFYYPFIAEVPVNTDEAHSISLYDPDSHDLALPTSIIWTGSGQY